jgi:tetratricopeptide (TPR) repeat protein
LTHYELGHALYAKGDLAGAITSYRDALRIKPDYAEAHCNLGLALADKGHLDEAIAEYRKAIASRQVFPEAHFAHYNLGNLLSKKGRLDEAIAAYREAIRLQPGYVSAHYNLGLALADKGRQDEAIAEFREALNSKQPFSDAHFVHTVLGIALARKGCLDEAIAEFRKAIRLKKDYAVAHNYLGLALKAQGDLPEALACYKTALALDPKYTKAHYNLGLALYAQGDLAGAIASYKKAIALHPKFAVAHNSLAQAERMTALQGKLADFLQGKYKPRSSEEWLGLAEISQFKKLHRVAATLYADAFAADPKLAADLKAGHRYNAACLAALAAAGQGEDAAKLEANERTRLRQQTLDWLKADLVAWTKLAEEGSAKTRAAVQQTLEHWKQDPDLASVRGDAALAKLPADEQPGWRQLWADVEKTLARARQENPQPEKSTKKQ